MPGSLVGEVTATSVDEVMTPMTLLSRLYGVRRAIRHPVRVRRDVQIPAADGVRLPATPYYPADVDRPPLVLLRSPYGRGNALDRLPKPLAERGYQVLYQSLRGTAGSLGFVEWELAARHIPEWKIAVIQDAPPAFAEHFRYPGGAFALGNALGWVQLVDTMFSGNFSLTRQRQTWR